MSTSPTPTQAASFSGSRIQQMLGATKRLPVDLQQLFETLYVRGLAEERACEELQLTPEALSASKASLFKCLKAAAA